MPLLSAIGAGLGAVQAGVGLYQSTKAQREIDRLGDRPDATIPQAVEEATELARRQAQEGLPAETQQLFNQQQDRSVATQLAASRDRRGGLAGIGAVGAQLADSSLQLASMNAQQQIANRTAYQQQLARLADEQRRVEEENVLGRYDANLARLEGQRAGGIQTLQSGIQSGLNAGALFQQSGTSGMQAGTRTPEAPLSLPTGGQGYGVGQLALR